MRYHTRDLWGFGSSGSYRVKMGSNVCFVCLFTAEPTRGTEVPLPSDHNLPLRGPPPYPISPIPPPLPLISTFQHTDTVAARAGFQRGSWSVSRPASRWPCAGHVTLTLLHNDTPGLLWDCGGGHAPGLRGHSCPHKISSLYHICAEKELVFCRAMHGAVFHCAYQWRSDWACTMQMHLAFPAMTFDISRKAEQSVRKQQEESRVLNNDE